MSLDDYGGGAFHELTLTDILIMSHDLNDFEKGYNLFNSDLGTCEHCNGFVTHVRCPKCGGSGKTFTKE